jgi:hypothetical protein
MDYNSNDWKSYTEAEKQIMLKLMEIRGKLDIIDIMIMKNVRDTSLMEKHFENKFKKMAEQKNDK